MNSTYVKKNGQSSEKECRKACLPENEDKTDDDFALPKSLRILFTVNVYAAFVGFAICRSLYGPTLLELQHITQASMPQVSTVFTWLGAGGIAGSLTYGWLFDRYPPLLLFLISMLLMGAVTIIIPFCIYLSMLMTTAAIQSFIFTGISVGCNVTIFRLWRTKTSSFFLAMHMLYTVGGFLAPILSEPFLIVRSDSRVQSVHSFVEHSTTHNLTVASVLNETFTNFSNHSHNSSSIIPQSHMDFNYTNTPMESRIYYTYIIIGLYLEAVALLTVVTMVCGRHHNLNLSKISMPTEVETPKKVTRFMPWSLFLVLNMLFGGIETMFSGLLFTYASVHVGMSNVQSSLLVSMLFVSYACGRFSAIFTLQCIPPRFLLMMDILLSLGGASALSYFSTNSVVALWICTILFSIGASTVFSTALLWARDFLALTGRFTSTYVIAYTVGMMTWPVLTGYLVQTEGASWFPYINTVLLVGYAFCFATLWLIRCSRQRDMKVTLRKHVVTTHNEDDLIASLHSLRAEDDLIASLHSLRAI